MLIHFKDLVIKVDHIVAVIRGVQPATMIDTVDVPYLHIVLRDAQPIVVPYDSVEIRDKDYETLVMRLKDLDE